MKQTFVLDFHDLEIGRPGLEEVLKLKEHYPALKVTLFMVPLAQSVLNGKITPKQYQEWADFLKKQDWIELCPHGVTHQGDEMLHYRTPKGRKAEVHYEMANLYIDAAEHTFKQLGLPFKKIWASPHWLSSWDTLKALWDRGYTLAVDPNQLTPSGGPTYKWNWSIDKSIPISPLVKGHGHLYPPSPNAIQTHLGNLLKIPTNAEFRWVSEVL